MAWALLTLLVCGAVAVPLVDEITPRVGESCGYESCPVADEGVLNVHIVPHTHDDVGWLKTVDQYYYGSRSNIQKAGVQYILDSVVRELWEDPKRRFIYVETAFFWKWWMRQHDSIRHKVHTLVRQGRLEFIGGAWSMNDEAATHYQCTVDQFTWGLRKLNDTFGPCGRPRIGWQIDPFGHSREFASLLAAMGYDGLFHGRIDYQDKVTRVTSQTMEMLWRGNDDLGAASDIFTGILFNTYSPPPGFCFDVLCSDEPIVDDPDSPIYNVNTRVGRFLRYVLNEQRSAYRTDNVIITMGGDFTYMDANQWYTNLDKLIKYTNLKAAKDGLNVKLFYSTPSCYLKAVYDAAPTLPTKQDDFFPYASDPHSYWTGYFTSRPTVKWFERVGNAYLQTVKQLQVLAGLEDHNRFVLDELKSAMGVMQHHDAVTGTEKQHVAADYCRMLDDAIEDALTIARQAFSKITEGDALRVSEFSFDRCSFNISQCATSEDSEQFVVTVYNPLGWSRNAHVRVPIIDRPHSVLDNQGHSVATQVVEVPDQVIQIPVRNSSATHELVFIADAVPALGYRTYYIKQEKRTKRNAQDDYYPQLQEYTKEEIQEVERRNVFLQEIQRYFKDLPKRENEVKKPAVEASEVDVFKTLGEKYFDYSGPPLKGSSDYNARLKTLEGKSDVETQTDRDKPKYIKFSSLSDDELRMLADEPMVVEKYSNDDFIENQYYKLSMDKTTGKLTNLQLADGTSMSFDAQFLYYPGWLGNNQNFERRSSGAYIFRPNATRPTAVDDHLTAKIIKGDVVQELHQTHTDYVSSVFRLYKNSPLIEVEWLVGPIPIEDDVGKEIILRYSTDLVNNGVFFTDSNGKQTLERRINHRPQWNLSVIEPVAGNYYPVNGKIFIEDNNQNLRFTVLNDRAQGGSSLNEGELELMLHRRLLHDDAFGVGEALNETAAGIGLVARGKHYLSIGHANLVERRVIERKNAIEVHLPPQVFVSNAKKVGLDNWLKLKNEWSALKGNLPNNVHLLTLEPWRGNKLLLRFENYVEKTDLLGENGTAKVNLKEVFANLNVIDMKETSLAANQWFSDRKPLSWMTENDFTTCFFDASNDRRHRTEGESVNVIELDPMEIRTFVVEYEAKV